MAAVASPLCRTSRPLSFESSSLAGCRVQVPVLNSLPACFMRGPLEIVASKKLQGTVVKTISDKTAAVEVVRLAPHPRYKKRVKVTKRYQAHDPENQCQVGDVVTLVKIPPVSKTKKFQVGEIRHKSEKTQRAELTGLPPFESDVVAAA
eukprot:TRINITY_DN8064_c0_g1_i1.p1 TRINITY_DN8064_c0_g1~~TRINITY_DN8064_c0_g1_i1.p1  ORF type:complete len:163 (+),score=25.13 TRINITY_DN8064_c0_g1_i1:45-491(+)